MGKLNIEAVTGLTPKQLGLSDDTDFIIDEKGNLIGIATSDGGFDYEEPIADLGEVIEQVNEEKGEAE